MSTYVAPPDNKIEDEEAVEATAEPTGDPTALYTEFARALEKYKIGLRTEADWIPVSRAFNRFKRSLTQDLLNQAWAHAKARAPNWHHLTWFSVERERRNKARPQYLERQRQYRAKPAVKERQRKYDKQRSKTPERVEQTQRAKAKYRAKLKAKKEQS